MEKNTVLLISCTIGYGHQAATQNIEQRLRKQNPDLNIITLDTKDYLSPIAIKVSNQWDERLRRGNFFLTHIAAAWGIYETLTKGISDIKLSRAMSKLFEEHHITAVYDMQPLFTASFYKAFARACKNRSLTYHKILTDLPTPRNMTFLGGIKRTRLFSDNVQFKLHAPTPILTPHQTLESFWHKNCRLTPAHIDESFAFPVHADYLQMPTHLDDLKLDISPDWQIHLPLPEQAHVTTLMLGSQGVNAIYDYAVRYLEQITEHSPQQPHYFFIACSKNEALYQSICDLLASHPLHRTTPHRIIPLRMQTLAAIASLMWRSDQVIIRSGGISSLEQLALARTSSQPHKKLWIHSFSKDNDPSQLLEHTYAWERGNAEYLIHHLGAQMTAPQVVRFFG